MQKYLFLLQIFRNDHDKLEFTFESRHTVVLAMLMFLIKKVLFLQSHIERTYLKIVIVPLLYASNC